MIASWAHFPKLTSAARQAWQSKSRTGTDEFKDVLKQSWELYSVQLQLFRTWRTIYQCASDDVSNAKDEDSATRASYLYAFNQRMYSISVFNVSYINCLIRAMLPLEAGISLRKEAVEYSHEIVALAHAAMRYRPLGSGFISLCLMVAWFTPADDDMRREIESLWELYTSDFPMASRVKLEGQLDACNFLGAV